MTFQNIFSSMADFRDEVSVLPAARLIKASRIFEVEKKANRRTQGVFSSFLIVTVVEHGTLKKRLIVNWLAPKKGAFFSLIYFFKSFCICYIPHNYFVPQAMPHAILQTHSAFYPHRFMCSDWWISILGLCQFLCVCGLSILAVILIKGNEKRNRKR